VNAVHEESHTIRTFDVGADGKLVLRALLDYLQNAAANHVNELALEALDLNAKGLTWVLSRYRLNVIRYPNKGEPISLKTWPSMVQKLFVFREFEIFGNDGEVIVRASTAWLIIDAKSLRPVRPNHHLEGIEFVPKRALDEAFESWNSGREPDNTNSYRVRMEDIDLNDHVNNRMYMLWASEALPTKLRSAYVPVDLTVQFLGMSHYGDEIHVATIIEQKADAVHSEHEIRMEERLLAKVKIHWTGKGN
jgi:medium-chain acyl-[acyl-carrier-protein] hydrolase